MISDNLDNISCDMCDNWDILGSDICDNGVDRRGVEILSLTMRI